MTLCRSPHCPKRGRGFTLIEVMVVLIIASLMVGLIVFGFDQTLNRRKGAAAEKVFQWLNAAADTAVFQSTVVGVAQKENQLILLAFYQDDWFKLADQEALELREEISLVWSESLIRNNEIQGDRFGQNDENNLKPYVVIMPSGEVLPEGEIHIFDQDKTGSTFRKDGDALAVIRWEEDMHFGLHWQVAK